MASENMSPWPELDVFDTPTDWSNMAMVTELDQLRGMVASLSLRIEQLERRAEQVEQQRNEMADELR